MNLLWLQTDPEPAFEFTLDPLFQEHGLPLAAMGILIVFSALVLLIVCISILPRLLSLLPDAPTPSTVATPSADTELDEELSPELLAVITAAVAEVIRSPHVIVRVQGLTPEDLGWSLEGRMHHHQSHGISQWRRR